MSDESIPTFEYHPDDGEFAFVRDLLKLEEITDDDTEPAVRKLLEWYLEHTLGHVVSAGEIEFNEARCGTYKDHFVVDTNDGRAWKLADTERVRLVVDIEVPTRNGGELRHIPEVFDDDE